MSVRMNDLLKPREGAVLAVWFLAAGLIYGLLIRPSLQLCADLDQARAAKAEAKAELSRTGTRLAALRRQIRQAHEELAKVGGPPPHEKEKDLQVAHLTMLATGAGITVDQYTPMDVADNGDYRAFFFQFAGRGGFEAIRRYFQQVESDVDFVDLTHFAISVIPNDETPTCSVNWSCQVNGVRTEIVPPAEPAQQEASRPGPLTEVALDER